MARENQGLHIALIIFVLLTVVFSGLTFWCFKLYKEAAERADQFDKTAKEKQTAYDDIKGQYGQLKKLVGFAESDGLPNIQSGVKEDMEKYAGTFEPENQVYRKVLQYLNDALQKKNADLVKEQEEVKRYALELARFEDIKKPQIQQALDKMNEYGNDLTSEHNKHNTIINDINSKNEELLTNLQNSRKKAVETVEAAQAKQKELEDQIARATELYKNTRTKLETMITPTFEVAHGTVRWVDQRTGTLWINLGRADGLKRQVTFSVYSSDTNDVTKAGRKGSIEVTEILSEHMAEARIVEDKAVDPITPGDVIHTPVWAPGHKEHFALAGFIDIDGDGVSDREMVKNLIAANGAVVDAEVTDDGERHGEMTADTHYLVEGTSPSATSDPRVTNAFSAMEKEAEKLGVRTITVEKLLQEMGYKDEARVAHFSKHINPKEFPARQPDGQVPRLSPGTVSPLYMDKAKPHATRGSAY